MSGIAFDVALDGADAALAVSRMMSRMAYRGRDAAALVSGTDTSLSYAMGQLSTWATPEDEGLRGPLRGTDGHLVAFDGRLDRVAALRAELDLADDAPDREIVLAAFRRWDRDAPSRLDGDFAFAVWHPARRRLFVARDRLGAVAVFFHEHVRGVRIASEKRALLVDERCPARPNRAALAMELVAEYAERDTTILQGVRAIAPGTWLDWSDGKLSRGAYWELEVPRTVSYRDRRAYEDELRELLRSAIRERMRARGPVGIAVSGGLDSSAVAAIAVADARESGAAEPALATFRFEGLDCDETWFSERLARHLDAPLLALAMPTRGEPYAPRDLGDLLYHPMFALYEALAKARPDVRVLLTGQGSDELQWWTHHEAESALDEGAITTGLRLAGMYEAPLSIAPWRKLLGIGARRVGALPRRVAGLETRDPPTWMTADAAHLVARGREEERQALLSSRERSAVTRVLVAGLTRSAQVPLGLAQLSLTGAVLGMEIRNPFLDHRLVERFLSYPLAVRYDFSVAKPLLRAASAPFLPPSLAWRSASPSFESFLRRALSLQRTELERLFAPARLEALDLVRPGALAKVRADERSPTWAGELGVLVSTEAWLGHVGL